MGMRESVGAFPTTRIEGMLWSAGAVRVAGVDEAGRGAWAGPVVAAAVVLDPHALEELLPCVRDSKQLSANQRTAAARVIRARAMAVGVGTVASRVIDEAGLAFAGQLAFWRALRSLRGTPDYVLVDGFPLWSDEYRQAAVLQGDQHCLSIAAASIIAKVTRDDLMRSLDRLVPGYGFAAHKGYGSVGHREALLWRGPSTHHRRSFRPVAALDGEGALGPPA